MLSQTSTSLQTTQQETMLVLSLCRAKQLNTIHDILNRPRGCCVGPDVDVKTKLEKRKVELELELTQLVQKWRTRLIMAFPVPINNNDAMSQTNNQSVIIPLCTLPPNLLSLSAKKLNDEAIRHQDIRDVERDSIALKMQDGTTQTLKGAELKYAGVVNALLQRATKVCESCFFDTSEHTMLEAFVQSVLHMANRTSTGGDTFDALKAWCDGAAGELATKGTIMVDTSVHYPLEIDFQLAPFRRENVWDFGLIAVVRAQMKYLIFDPSDAEFSHATFQCDTLLVREFAFMLPMSSSFVNEGECDERGTLHVLLSPREKVSIVGNE